MVEAQQKERICLIQSLIVEMAPRWAVLVTRSRAGPQLFLEDSVAEENTDSEEEKSVFAEGDRGSTVAFAAPYIGLVGFGQSH